MEYRGLAKLSSNDLVNILKRLDVSVDEIESLINTIRSDGWRSYQTVSKKLGIVHNRAVLRDPKDSIKLFLGPISSLQMLKRFLPGLIEVYQEG